MTITASSFIVFKQLTVSLSITSTGVHTVYKYHFTADPLYIDNQSDTTKCRVISENAKEVIRSKMDLSSEGKKRKVTESDLTYLGHTTSKL